MWRMHAEAVKCGGIPSMPGLIHDRSRAMTCAECDARYDLYYDLEAEMRFTLCSILAAEIITARHPDHEPSLVLELPEQGVHSAGLAKLAQEKAGYHLAKPPAGSHPAL
jgi:hypothetical protein